MPSDRPTLPAPEHLSEEDDEALHALQRAAALVRSLGEEEVRRLLELVPERDQSATGQLIARMNQAAQRCRSVRERVERRSPTSPDLLAVRPRPSTHGLRAPEPGAVDDVVETSPRLRAWPAADDGPPTGVRRTPFPHTREERDARKAR